MLTLAKKVFAFSSPSDIMTVEMRIGGLAQSGKLCRLRPRVQNDLFLEVAR